MTSVHVPPRVTRQSSSHMLNTVTSPWTSYLRSPLLPCTPQEASARATNATDHSHSNEINPFERSFCVEGSKSHDDTIVREQDAASASQGAPPSLAQARFAEEGRRAGGQDQDRTMAQADSTAYNTKAPPDHTRSDIMPANASDGSHSESSSDSPISPGRTKDRLLSFSSSQSQGSSATSTALTSIECAPDHHATSTARQHQPVLKTRTLALSDISMAPSESSLELLSRHMAEQHANGLAPNRLPIHFQPEPAPLSFTPLLDPSASNRNEDAGPPPIPLASRTAKTQPTPTSPPPRAQSVFLPALGSTPTLTPSARSLSVAQYSLSQPNSQPVRSSGRKRTRRHFSDDVVVNYDDDAVEEEDHLAGGYGGDMNLDMDDGASDVTGSFVSAPPPAHATFDSPNKTSRKGKGKSTNAASTKASRDAAALERNRLAAVRSREKKKRREAGLEVRVEELLAANTALHLTAQALIAEARELRSALPAGGVCLCGTALVGGGETDSAEAYGAPAAAQERSLTRAAKRSRIAAETVPAAPAQMEESNAPSRESSTASTIEHWRMEVDHETAQAPIVAPAPTSTANASGFVVDERAAIPLKRRAAAEAS